MLITDFAPTAPTYPWGTFIDASAGNAAIPIPINQLSDDWDLNTPGITDLIKNFTWFRVKKSRIVVEFFQPLADPTDVEAEPQVIIVGITQTPCGEETPQPFFNYTGTGGTPSTNITDTSNLPEEQPRTVSKVLMNSEYGNGRSRCRLSCVGDSFTGYGRNSLVTAEQDIIATNNIFAPIPSPGANANWFYVWAYTPNHFTANPTGVLCKVVVYRTLEFFNRHTVMGQNS